MNLEVVFERFLDFWGDRSAPQRPPNCFKFQILCQYFPSQKMVRFVDPILQILVRGDFNARVFQWSMSHPDSKGKRILQITANTGSSPTFRRPGCIGSTPHIIFASKSLLTETVGGWRVPEKSSANIHQYIPFEMVHAICQRAPLEGA